VTGRTLRLFIVIGQAAFLYTVACFVLTILLFRLIVPPDVESGPPPREPSLRDAIALVAVFVVPAALGFWWIVRKLRAEYPPRQALGAALAFAVFSPVPLIFALAVGPIVGGYSGIFLGTDSRLVAFSGAALGIVVMIAFMTFVPSLLAVLITRHIGCDVQQTR
jgi:hypothetical protein